MSYQRIRPSLCTDVDLLWTCAVDRISQAQAMWRPSHVWGWVDAAAIYLQSILWVMAIFLFQYCGWLSCYIICISVEYPPQSVNVVGTCQASASYWRGRADRESLQRVYGISYPDSKKLKVCLGPPEQSENSQKLSLSNIVFCTILIKYGILEWAVWGTVAWLTNCKPPFT